MAEKTTANSDEVIAKRVTFSSSGLTYCTRGGARKHSEPGEDITDMCQADLDVFVKLGVIQTKLVEVK